MAHLFIPPGNGNYSRWARQLKADYSGRAQSGQWFCLLTWRDPIGKQPLWSLGWGESEEQARHEAEQQMVQQRWDLERNSLIASLGL